MNTGICINLKNERNRVYSVLSGLFSKRGIWRQSIFLLAFLFTLLNSASAKHIVGGEIYYDYISTGNYKITLKLYRDCSSNGGAPYDSPAPLTVFDAGGNFVTTINMAFPGSTMVPNTINNPCISAPTNICVEEAIYIANVNLPPKTGGYYIVYQRCCRNNTILNLINPGSVGATYYEHIPGPEVTAINSSPRYNLRPEKYVCNGLNINFDHSAKDPDGDSLVYSFHSPYTGLDECCPALGVAPQSSSGCPIPPSSCSNIAQPPPYNFVPFVSPYSGNAPISSNPVLQINPRTGLISGAPNINGQWVIGVMVKEYRHGVLIGEHMRDFQYNVTACRITYLSAIQAQTQFCFGLTVNFQNLSINGTAYLWDFGDPTTNSDVSSATNPSYTYPDTGKYVVTLIVNPGDPCTDTSKQTFYVYPLLNPQLNSTYTNACVADNLFNFVAGGNSANYATFNWSFGSNASPMSSALQHPPPVTFNAAGSFPIKLVVKQATCIETVIDTVHVYEPPKAHFNTGLLEGCQPYLAHFSDSSLHGTPLTYNWNFGDGTTSNLSNPAHIYNNPGIYNVSLTIITTTGCKDTSTFNIPGMITVKPSPQAGFIADPIETDIFNSTINFADTSRNGVSVTFNLADGNIYNYVPANHYYDNFGNFYVTQIVIGSNGCTDTAKVLVKILPEFLLWVPNAFTPFTKDNINDVFKPIGMGVTDYTMYIFDRWGNLLFKTNNLEEGWDGTYKGKQCQVDVYVYKLDFKDMVEYKHHVKAGRVTLIK